MAALNISDDARVRSNLLVLLPNDAAEAARDSERRDAYGGGGTNEAVLFLDGDCGLAMSACMDPSKPEGWSFQRDTWRRLQ